MKRVVAIGLLFSFCFNVGGYYLLFWGLRAAAERQLARKIENNQIDHQTQYQFKIPLVMPYPLQETGYVPASGTFGHEGQLYTLIQQKYENDTLHVICVLDIQQNRLNSALNEYAQHASNDAVPAGNGIKLTKPTSEFERISEITICEGNCWSVQQAFSHSTFGLLSGHLFKYSPPPDGHC